MNLDNQNTPDFNKQWEIDPDVLKALRENAEFSIDDDKRVLAVLDEVHTSTAQLISDFIGADVRAEGKQVEVLKVDLNAPQDASASDRVIGKVEGDEDKLLYVISINGVDFKKVLQIALSGKFDEAKNNSEKPLTAAEKKLQLRLYNQLAEDLYANFDVLSVLGVPRKPFEITKEQFDGYIELEQLASVSMKFISCKTDFEVSLAVPLELLTAEPEPELSPEELKQIYKQERQWKDNLRTSIEDLPVSLNAKVLDAEISLNEVSRLGIGDLVSVTFGESAVPVSFEDGMKVFFARTELQKNQLFLRVTSGIET